MERSTVVGRAWAANRLGLDYAAEAERLGAPVVPIIDGHAHINGGRAAAVYKDVMDRFGVVAVYSQTQLSEVQPVRDVLGDRLRIVAIPNYMGEDPRHEHTAGFYENLPRWWDLGARMVKFWCGPRGRDMGAEFGEPMITTLDHPWRRRQMDRAAELGMVFMAHIADPDTWFRTRYTDAEFYGTKAEQYEMLERAAEAYDVPWLIAHMGGIPEDLEFLSGLLDRHPNFVVDTSATKWMVRELSAHPREDVVAFLERHRGRVVFGTDVVTMDAHLGPGSGPRGMGAQASGEAEAFELYASRYWAFRTMLETAYDGESPIADPDLAMVDPDRHDEMSAPRLRGLSLEGDALRALYRSAAESSLEAWYGIDTRVAPA
jgi:hypothetical protein